MSALRVSLLGTVRVDHRGRSSETGLGRAVKGLLGYLALFSKRIHSREVLAGIFWGDSSEDRARSCLSTTLWRLRKVLEPSPLPTGAYLVTTPTGEIGFNRESDYWIDVEDFESKVRTFLAEPCESLRADAIRQVENALNLYKGELLEGFYDEWALRERERIRALFVKCQIHLLHHYRHRHAWEKGLVCAQNILNLDPLREEIHREMMRLYYHNGQRALALRQYATCREILATELSIAPMEETQFLYAQISQKNDVNLEKNYILGDLATTRHLLGQFRKNIHAFEASMATLKHSVQNLEEKLKRQEEIVGCDFRKNV